MNTQTYFQSLKSRANENAKLRRLLVNEKELDSVSTL